MVGGDLNTKDEEKIVGLHVYPQENEDYLLYKFLCAILYQFHW